jgi:hypothetical protein
VEEEDSEGDLSEVNDTGLMRSIDIFNAPSAMCKNFHLTFLSGKISRPQ